MDMIGHQAECVNFTFQLFFPLRQIVEVVKVIIVTGKNGLPVMATLDNVVGIVGNDGTCGSGHADFLPSVDKRGQENKSVPFLSPLFVPWSGLSYRRKSAARLFASTESALLVTNSALTGNICLKMKKHRQTISILLDMGSYALPFPNFQILDISLS